MERTEDSVSFDVLRRRKLLKSKPYCYKKGDMGFAMPTGAGSPPIIFCGINVRTEAEGFEQSCGLFCIVESPPHEFPGGENRIRTSLQIKSQ